MLERNVRRRDFDKTAPQVTAEVDLIETNRFFRVLERDVRRRKFDMTAPPVTAEMYAVETTASYEKKDFSGV